jgi:uncharacterized membrane protein YbjE (DUF340 family)
MVGRRFIKDYELSSSVDENGREKRILVYRGDHFSVSFKRGSLKSYRIQSFVLFVIIVAFHLGAGFINSNGMRQFYISLPYVLAFLPLYYMAAGIIALPKATRTYRRDETALSFERIRSSSKLLTVILAGEVIGALTFLIFGTRSTAIQPELAFLLLSIIPAVACAYLCLKQKDISIVKSNPGQEDSKGINIS